jgi:large subunit ribosomal protein L28
MSRRCVITGKSPAYGHNVSHSKRRTNRRFLPNVHYHRIFVPELGKEVRLKISTRALRTINKKGLMQTLKDEGLTLKEVLS